MKNEYIQPAMSVVDVEVMAMLASSEIKLSSEEHAEAELSNDRRGSWGDLWN